MDIQIKYKIMPQYLSVKASGKWTEDNAKYLIATIRDEADNCGHTQLYLDLIELSQPDSELIRFFSGVYVAKVLHPPFRIAVVGKSNNINHLGESAAITRGAIFKIFSDEKIACEWLLTKRDTEIPTYFSREINYRFK